MNNFYHKIATASVSIALSFALGINNEAKAAIFSLKDTTSFFVEDSNHDGLGDGYYGGAPLPVGINRDGTGEEYRAFYEFNTANLFLSSKTVITSAILRVRANKFYWTTKFAVLGVYGYIENGQTILSYYDAGEYLDGQGIQASYGVPPAEIFNFNVLPFINQIITNNYAFAGFGIRYVPMERSGVYLKLEQGARLIIETADVAEPVPEPTTIFGSALTIGIGGWLKRKKLNQQNKTTSRH